jgi:hypothetical protein
VGHAYVPLVLLEVNKNCWQFSTKESGVKVIVCCLQQAFLPKMANFVLQWQHVADMLPTFPAKQKMQWRTTEWPRCVGGWPGWDGGK